MGDIVDFDKAKEQANQKKKAKDKVKRTNDKLLRRMKSNDQRRFMKPFHFYILLFAIVALVTIISRLQP